MLTQCRTQLVGSSSYYKSNCQEISYDLMTGDVGGLEVVLLPKLRVLEVNQESLPTVLDHRASLGGVTCLLLDCRMDKISLLEPQLLNFLGGKNQNIYGNYEMFRWRNILGN